MNKYHKHGSMGLGVVAQVAASITGRLKAPDSGSNFWRNLIL